MKKNLIPHKILDLKQNLKFLCEITQIQVIASGL